VCRLLLAHKGLIRWGNPLEMIVWRMAYGVWIGWRMMQPWRARAALYLDCTSKSAGDAPTLHRSPSTWHTRVPCTPCTLATTLSAAHGTRAHSPALHARVGRPPRQVHARRGRTPSPHDTRVHALRCALSTTWHTPSLLPTAHARTLAGSHTSCNVVTSPSDTSTHTRSPLVHPRHARTQPWTSRPTPTRTPSGAARTRSEAWASTTGTTTAGQAWAARCGCRRQSGWTRAGRVRCFRLPFGYCLLLSGTVCCADDGRTGGRGRCGCRRQSGPDAGRARTPPMIMMMDFTVTDTSKACSTRSARTPMVPLRIL
jgi:hypothetical protein